MINQSGIIVSESLQSSLAPSVVEPVWRDQQLDGASVRPIFIIFILHKAEQGHSLLCCFTPSLSLVHIVSDPSLEQSRLQRLQGQHRATDR